MNIRIEWCGYPTNEAWQHQVSKVKIRNLCNTDGSGILSDENGLI